MTLEIFIQNIYMDMFVSTVSSQARVLSQLLWHSTEIAVYVTIEG